MALVQCPECGKSISDKAASCPNCGLPIVQQTETVNSNQSVICPVCNTPAILSMGKCPKCGFPLKKENKPIGEEYKEYKSRSLAILLALILGGIGAHKFYVDKPGSGFLYLLFVWTFIPAILGLIEAIRYLCMSNETFQESYRLKKL